MTFDPFIGLVELENRWQPSHEVILVGFQLLGTFLEVDVFESGHWFLDQMAKSIQLFFALLISTSTSKKVPSS